MATGSPRVDVPRYRIEPDLHLCFDDTLYHSAEFDAIARMNDTLHHATETILLDIPELESQSHLQSLQSGEAEMAASCREITNPFVIKRPNGEVLLHYHPSYFHNQTVRDTSKAIETLTSSNPKFRFTPPSTNDARHGQVNIVEYTNRYGAGNFGTLHCAMWMEQAKPDGQPCLSREMISGSRVVHHCATLLRNLNSSIDDINPLYAATAPRRWRISVDQCNKMLKYLPEFNLIWQHRIHAHSSVAVSANLPILLHRDMKDAHHGLTALYCTGQFSEAWLVIPGAGIKLRFRPEDCILMNTHVLAHYVLRKELVNETFYVFSWFNHQTVLDWVMGNHQHRVDMHRAVKAKVDRHLRKVEKYQSRLEGAGGDLHSSNLKRVRAE
jgi:hypothetical protein